MPPTTTVKPVILVTNDDGIHARGLEALVNAMKQLGEVVVVAPDKPQSGMGHAFTSNEPIRVSQVNMFGDAKAFACSGTPVDCVKFAVDKVMHRKPELCVSGVNHGSNHSINVIYSGTMSAAIEAGIEGIPAAGFSLMSYDEEAEMEAAGMISASIARSILKNGLPEGSILNVNIPALKMEKIRGIKICRQALAKWQEEYDERKDPSGRKYYWLTGKFVNFDKGEDTDVWALENDYVSVVPVHFDLTAHHSIGFLNEDWLVEF